MQKKFSLFLLFFVANANVFAMDEGNRPPVPEERHDQGLSQHDLDMFAENLAEYMYNQGYHNEAVDAKTFWQRVEEFENEILNGNEKEAIIRYFAAYTPDQAEIFQRHVIHLLRNIKSEQDAAHDYKINDLMKDMQRIMPNLVTQMSDNGQLANFRLNFQNLMVKILENLEVLFPDMHDIQNARQEVRQIANSLNVDQQNMLLQAFAQARNAYIPKVPGTGHVSPNRLARAVKVARELANAHDLDDLIKGLVRYMYQNNKMANFRLNFNNLKQQVQEFGNWAVEYRNVSLEEVESIMQNLNSLDVNKQNELLQMFAEYKNAYIPKSPRAQVSVDRLVRAVKVANSLNAAYHNEWGEGGEF